MTPTEQQAVEWACAWVGHQGPLVVRDASGVVVQQTSLPDLAEKVRARMKDHTNGIDGRWAHLTFNWARSGPLAFIVAVMEMVEG